MDFSFDEREVSRKRIQLAKSALEKRGIDAMIFFDGDRHGRKFALTAAFTALVLFPNKEPIIVAHSIERDHAESESELEIIEIDDTSKLKGSLKRLLPRKAKAKRRKIAVIPWNVKFDKVKLLQELDCEIIDASDSVLQHCLKKPFTEEVDAIRRLSAICDKGLDAAHNAIEPGLRENEVAAEVDYVAEKSGATEFAFPTLVASGYRAAFPHGWTSDKKIRKRDVVVVDTGPILRGYDGCVCRTFRTDPSDKWIEEIEVVQEAIHGSLDLLKRLESVSARQIVQKHGYKTWPNMKTVWTGHPIGGFACPVVMPYSKDRIEEGMVFALEPGIYIRGKGGVRIEHHILAKRYGYEILDKFPENT